MPVSADEVRWAYRLLLGREAESDAVIEHWQGARDTRALVEHFLFSPEAQARARVPMLGRYVLEHGADVEVDADPETLARMLDRIREAWSSFGEEQPYWSVITDPDYAADSIAEHKDRFYASGADELNRVVAALHRAGVDPSTRTHVLDYGCGVGRITLSLASRFPQVTGIDISAGHVREAQARADETGITNADFRAIGSVEALNDLPRYELIVTFIVLQHNPPPVAAAILRRLLAALAPEGVAIFQIPTFLLHYHFHSTNYLATPQPPMEINIVPQADVFRIVDEAGCRVMEVREDLAIGDMPAVSQTFIVKKTK